MLSLVLATAIACGGSPTAPEAPAAPRIASVIVRPGVASLDPTETLRFTADVRDADGRPVQVPITWQASGGQIDAAGLYTAGATAGEFEVRAVSIGDVIGFARIRIRQWLEEENDPDSTGDDTQGSDPGDAGSDSPDDSGNDQPEDSGTDQPEDSGTDQPEDSGSNDPPPDPAPSDPSDGGSGGGTGGGDPAPPTQDPPAQDPPAQDPPAATTLTVTPRSVDLNGGQAIQFSVDLRDQYGDPMSDPVSWSSTGGSISQTGFYVAGSKAGDYSVTARAAGLSSSASIRISVPQPSTNGVPISPGESIQTMVQNHPAGTTFVIKAGVHQRQSVEPKDGMTFVGENGAVMDGGGIGRFAFGSYGPGARGVTIKNLEIRNYQTSISEGAIQGDNTRDWVLDGNEIHNNGGFGVRGGPGMKVLNNHAHDNGDAGIHGYKADGMIVEGNEVDHNGDAGVQGGTYATAAGMKFFKIRDLVVRNNYVHDNGARGIWCDTDCIDVLIEGNRVVANGDFGIWVEISYRTKVLNNHVERNGYDGYGGSGWLGGGGIAVSNSPDVEIAFNTLIDNADGIAGMQATGYPSSGAYGPYRLENLWVHDNTIVMSHGRSGIVTNGGNDVFDRWNNRFDRNRYTLNHDDDAFAWRGGTRDPAEWQGYGLDPNGTFD